MSAAQVGVPLAVNGATAGLSAAGNAYSSLSTVELVRQLQLPQQLPSFPIQIPSGAGLPAFPVEDSSEEGLDSASDEANFQVQDI